MKQRIRSFIELLLHRAFNNVLKSSYGTKVTQRNLFVQYQHMARTGQDLPPIEDTGYRIYSQFDEDGIFVFLFSVLGVKSKTFIEIGSADGINSNCANLAVNFGWHGLFIDGSEAAIARGKRFYRRQPDNFLYPPKFICAKVKRSNVNDLISKAGFEGEIDLLSIDIDGNDYWIWDVLDCTQPRVVCIETHIEFGYNDIVVPYDEDYVYPGAHPDYHGASPVAMLKLANRKGYRLVGANLYGFNTIYVRYDLGNNLIPTRTVEDILKHPRNKERFELFKAIKDMPFVR
jgi:hypothetical protein